MPKAGSFQNAFDKKELNRISGLSMPMIDYLERSGYIKAAYVDESSGTHSRAQGKVRYYSYRDLVVAKIIQQLREAGVRLSKLKSAIQYLHSNAAWSVEEVEGAVDEIRWLLFDGKELQLLREDGFLDELKSGGQRSFAFVVGIQSAKAEVYDLIPDSRRADFTMENRSMIRATKRTA